jgi:para-nitrobenzyl esterase
MKTIGRALQLAFLIGAMGTGAAGAAEPTVRTDAGRLLGSKDRGVHVFKGVPYAAPPIGDRRWRPPGKAAAWSGVRPAQAFGAICPQGPAGGDKGVGSEPPSEDCLTLNVWTSDLRPLQGAPVMVWIHGGGFTSGSGSAPLYDARALAQRGVVVVTFNYRLGRLGFFAHPALAAEGGAQGNYALMDQVAALQWVRRNIRAFGGDPRNVTLFGNSAGGWSVNQLMLAGPARGLFQKAIVQSGLGRERPLTMERARREGQAFVAALGRPAADAAALRRLPVEALIADKPSIYDGFGPILDGRLVQSSVIAGFERGRQARIPYLAGFNSLEIPANLLPDRSVFARVTPVLSPDQARRGAAAYGGAAALQNALIGDVLFAEPAVAVATAHAATGAPTFLYRFDVVATAARARLKGAPHASERAYVFSTLDQLGWPADPSDHSVSDQMAGYWTTFARHGDVNGAGRPHWSRINPGDARMLDLSSAGAVVVSASNPQLDFVKGLQGSKR